MSLTSDNRGVWRRIRRSGGVGKTLFVLALMLTTQATSAAPLIKSSTPKVIVCPAKPAEVAETSISATQLSYRHRPMPIYPQIAMDQGHQGMVRVKLLIDQNGHPQQVSLSHSSGHAGLDEAALSATRASLFYPYVVDGKTVRVIVNIPFRFQLDTSQELNAVSEILKSADLKMKLILRDHFE